MSRSILTALPKCLFLSVSLFLALPDVASAAPTMQQWQAGQSQTYTLLAARRNREAEASAKQLVGIAEQMGPLPRNFGVLVDSLGLLARAYEEQNRPADAIPVRRRYLEVFEAQLGKEHPDVCLPLATLARLYVKTGKTAEAEAAYKRAVAIREKADPEHATGALMNLARFYQKLNKHKEAEETYLRLAALYEKQNGARDPRLKPILIELANLATAQGHEKEAKSYAARSAKIG